MFTVRHSASLDFRSLRHPHVTGALPDRGRDLLVATLPVWRETHAEIDRALPGLDPERLRTDLRALA